MIDHKERARELLADALEIEPSEVGADASIDTMASWTSMGHMRLILALEEALGGQLDSATIVEIASIDDVASVLERDGAG